MNVNETENADQAEVRHSLALTDLPIMENRQRMPKQKTARLKIIHGRPYYYEIENVWDRKAQRCHQKSKYLGKELPRGYRLTK